MVLTSCVSSKQISATAERGLNYCFGSPTVIYNRWVECVMKNGGGFPRIKKVDRKMRRKEEGGCSPSVRVRGDVKGGSQAD